MPRKAFLNSLWTDQKAKATYTFEDDERFDWHFIPKLRKGLSFGEMQPYQPNSRRRFSPPA